MISMLLAIIYLSFISLGLPDALLGAAWPSIYPQLNVPVSYAGIVSMIIAIGTVISSLQSDRMTLKLGTGKVTALSVATTAIALVGFSFTRSFVVLCLWAIPYGLGAGSVDASLNNYVALHYESKHMSWLHCMWGVGATLGPYVMGYALTSGAGWNQGYRIVGILQIALTAMLILSLSKWRNGENAPTDGAPRKAMPLSAVLRIPGALSIMLCFFCYCAVETTAGLWAASYLTLGKGVSNETAASLASMFYLGITLSRAVSGFVTMKLNDTQMVRLGQGIVALGAIAMLIPGATWLSLAGLILIGVGCAPMYPCMLHATPDFFGADKSQAIVGVQMASAYIGTCCMPPLFGLIANHVNIALLPAYLLGILAVMAVMYARLTNGK